MKLAIIVKLDDAEQLLYRKSNGKWDYDPLSAEIMTLDKAMKILETSQNFVGIFTWDPKNDPHPFLGIGEELITLTEASKILNISLPTLYARVKNRNVPYCHRNGKTYITKEMFEKFIVPKFLEKDHG